VTGKLATAAMPVRIAAIVRMVAVVCFIVFALSYGYSLHIVYATLPKFLNAFLLNNFIDIATTFYALINHVFKVCQGISLCTAVVCTFYRFPRFKVKRYPLPSIAIVKESQMITVVGVFCGITKPVLINDVRGR
jgi:hypothetical protein